MDKTISIALRALAEIIKLVNSIKAQEGLTTAELWEKADDQTKANKAEIQAFLSELP